MAEQDQNRNESATPFKLDEARKQGSVPKSLDTNSFVMLVVGTFVIHIWGGSIAAREMRLFASILSNAHHQSFDAAVLSNKLTSILVLALEILAPVAMLLCVAAILVNFAQTGPIFSSTPIKPDFKRLNPITGFKRIFSLRLLLETGKTFLKFLLLGAVLYYAMLACMPQLFSMLHMAPPVIASVLSAEMSRLLLKLLAAFAVIALIDLAYSRWDFAKKLRMSRREIRDEFKRREGDPRIKARQRELQREMLKRAGSIGQVKDADALIVNPVRLAVAVKYHKDTVDAPIVTAKGAGFLAHRMRAAAKQHGVPVIQNKALARALFHKVSIDQTVPAEHFSALAKILLWVLALRGKALPWDGKA